MINPPQDGLPVAAPQKPRKSPPTLKSVETPVSEAVPGDPVPATDLAARRAARAARRARAAEAEQKPEALPPVPDPAADLAARRAARAERRAARQAEREQFPGLLIPAEAGSAPDLALAYPRRRHWVAIMSFALLVILPVIATLVYLYVRAADQYHSDTAFSIRSEEMSSAASGILGAITQMGSGTATDATILSEYIRSQKIVENINGELDLRAIYNKTTGDPVFSLGPDTTIEQLLGYWSRMVDVSFDSGAGIIHVRANAFTPGDAKKITQAILNESSALVNRLSDQARSDAIHFAAEELAETEGKLRDVRKQIADFRHEHRLVDPSADVAGQMGLLNSLQNQLAQAMVAKDELLTYAGDTDQRVLQANRRIDAITARIDQERDSLDVVGVEGNLPEVVGAYEALRLDLEFATTAYTHALASLTAAQAEARRQSRYLATHIQPTLAQSALYPRRPLIAGLTALFMVLGWSVLMLIYYNVRDNR